MRRWPLREFSPPTQNSWPPTSFYTENVCIFRHIILDSWFEARVGSEQSRFSQNWKTYARIWLRHKFGHFFRPSIWRYYFYAIFPVLLRVFFFKFYVRYQVRIYLEKSDSRRNKSNGPSGLQHKKKNARGQSNSFVIPIIFTRYF